MAAPIVHTAVLAKLEMQIGTDWLEVPGARGYRQTAGGITETDVVGWGGIRKVAGNPRVPTAEISLLPAPAHRAYIQLDKDTEARTTRRFRVTTKPTTEFDSGAGRVEIAATTGFAKFTMTPEPDFTTGEYSPGMVIQIGNALYLIDSFNDDGTDVKLVESGDLEAPGEKVEPATFKILTPALRKEFAAVPTLGDEELPEESGLTGTLTLTPKARIPRWQYAATF